MSHTHVTTRGRHAAPRRRHAAPKPPRRIGRRLRIGAALITAAGLLGAGCSATPTKDVAATAGRSAEPAATVTVTAQPAADTAGDECREYADWILEQMDAKDQIVLDAFMQMADILDRDGFMVTSEYVDIVNQATADMDELTTKMLTGPGFYCPAEG